jgi:uncharacterized protein
MDIQISIDQAKIAAFCQKWKISELSFFGSVLRDDFRPGSDVDVLVTFAPEARWSEFDVMDAEEELASIFGRPVDLIERVAVERGRNPLRKRSILSSTQVVYAAR